MFKFIGARILTSGLLFTSYFGSPQLAETCDEKREKFHPLSLLFSVNDQILREICESQTSVISVADITLANRAIYRGHIKNSQRPPQNTRDKGNLIFHSYSKKDVRAPCVESHVRID